MDKLLNIKRAWGQLEDDISRRLFEARVIFGIDRDVLGFHKRIMPYISKEINKKKSTMDFLAKSEQYESIMLYGAGSYGIISKHALDALGVGTKITCFVDRNYESLHQIESIPVIGIEEAIKKNRLEKYLIIVNSAAHFREMYNNLIAEGIKENDIVCMPWGYFNISVGKQYFDVFAPQENEVFVDAGSWDGSTAEEFMEWSEGKYKGVFSFEPLKNQYELIRQKAVNNDKWEVVGSAAWSRHEKLMFYDNLTGSRVEKSGNIEVLGQSIDSLRRNDITFIKMDVEGSELEALKGAKSTIINCKPKLAISIYHKPEDIIDIPAYIVSIMPEYRFRIRHYTYGVPEMVLYACV